MLLFFGDHTLGILFSTLFIKLVAILCTSKGTLCEVSSIYLSPCKLIKSLGLAPAHLNID